MLFFLLTNKGVDRDYQRPSFCCSRGGSDYGDKTGNRTGFCHGSFFPTFWMSGSTCYLASIITDEKYRGMGYGRLMVDHVKELAKERDCKAIILDSGMQRKAAHAFYEKYGFEKSCYGFELVL